MPEPRELASGKFLIRLRIDGQSISVTEDTEKKCRTKARAIKAGLIKTPKKPDDITLKEAIGKYIDSLENRLKDKSKEQYEYIRDQRFQSIMPLKLSEITKDKLDKAVEDELAKPSRKGGTLSAKTVRDAYMLVASVMHKYAPDIETQIRLPEIQRTFPELVPPDQILAAIIGTDIELPCLLAMWLSLSMSEIRGLTKSKSVRGNKLYIVETVVDVRKVGGKEELRPRALDIPPHIKKLIDVVPGDVVEPRSGHAVYMRLQVVLRDAGLPHMRFHDLRHINASIMADLNIPTSVAQERGGWNDNTMKRVYTHTFDSSRREADQKIDAYFDKLISDKKVTKNVESKNPPQNQRV